MRRSMANRQVIKALEPVGAIRTRRNEKRAREQANSIRPTEKAERQYTRQDQPPAGEGKHREDDHHVGQVTKAVQVSQEEAISDSGDVVDVDRDEISADANQSQPSSLSVTFTSEDNHPKDSSPAVNMSEVMTYMSPLSQRYRAGSEGMAQNFSEYKKVLTWRKLWSWLARAFQVDILLFRCLLIMRNG